MRRFDLSLDDVLEAVQSRPGAPTYVLRNILSRGRCHLDSSHVFTRLKTLERRGLVKRAPSNWAVMLCWQPAERAVAP